MGWRALNISFCLRYRKPRRRLGCKATVWRTPVRSDRLLNMSIVRRDTESKPKCVDISHHEENLPCLLSSGISFCANYLICTIPTRDLFIYLQSTRILPHQSNSFRCHAILQLLFASACTATQCKNHNTNELYYQH